MEMKRAKDNLIRDAAAAIDALGGNAKVGAWLHLEINKPAEPNTISGWRKRGISRNYAVHFYAELVERRGFRLAPQVFGLDSWEHVLMPDERGKRLRRVSASQETVSAPRRRGIG
jgi:hypothetical protein